MFNTQITLPTGKVLCMQGHDGLSPEDVQKALEQAYPRIKKGAFVTCNCTASTPVFLTIRKKTRKDKTLSFHIARFPNSSSKHVYCFFYEPEKNKCGLGDYDDGVIKETDEGLKIALDYPLVWKLSSGIQSPERKQPASQQRSASSPRLKAMSALGFLNLLWEKSALNSWSPRSSNKRGEHPVVNLLHATAETISVGNYALSDHFLALPPEPWRWDKDRFASLHQKQVNLKGCEERRLSVIFGSLTDIEDYKLICDGAKALNLSLKIQLDLADALRVPGGICAQAMKALELRKEAVSALLAQKSQSQEDGQENIELKKAQNDLDTSPRAIFCCLAYLGIKTKAGHIYAEVLDAAVMPVTAEWIPYSSSFEHQIARKLVDENRSFRKPLRYDASINKVFPDFELLDTGPKPYPLEVFGRTDETYETRKQEKIDYYNKEYSTAHWWYWIAEGDGKQSAPPDFPTPLP